MLDLPKLVVRKGMQLIIDRVEDNGFAVLEREDGATFTLPRDWLAEEAQERHVFVLSFRSR
jgi:hypothetical protein